MQLCLSGSKQFPLNQIHCFLWLVSVTWSKREDAGSLIIRLSPLASAQRLPVAAWKRHPRFKKKKTHGWSWCPRRVSSVPVFWLTVPAAWMKLRMHMRITNTSQRLGSRFSRLLSFANPILKTNTSPKHLFFFLHLSETQHTSNKTTLLFFFFFFSFSFFFCLIVLLPRPAFLFTPRREARCHNWPLKRKE